MGNRMSAPNVDSNPLLSAQDEKTVEILIHERRDDIYVENEGLPDELFIHCFSFLSNEDLCVLASVSRHWNNCAYTPYLWPILDLSKYSYAVHDNLIRHLLTTSSRFSEATHIVLEGCDAITSKSLRCIIERCPKTSILLLTNCKRVKDKSLLELVRRFPRLQRLELYGCGKKTSFVDQIRRINPRLDLGLFWYQYCAEKGILIQLYVDQQQDDYALDLITNSSQDQIVIDSPSQHHVDDRTGLLNVNGPSDSIHSRHIGAGVGLGNLNGASIEFEEKKELEAIELGNAAAGFRSDSITSIDFQFPLQDFPEDENVVPQVVPATCRHEGVFAGGGCWGNIKGRIIYSNQFYHRGGNFPSELLYSCESHDQLDFKDNEFQQCEKCSNLFRPDSCWSEDVMICNTCFDEQNMQNKRNWVKLTDKSIRELSFSDLIKKTLAVADMKNIPNTLKTVTSIKCDLDYSYAYENSELNHDDEIPSRLFWDGNQARVEDHLRHVKKSLTTAKQAQHSTRALLLYDDEDTTHVLTDRGVITDGMDGHEFLDLTLDAWSEFYSIILPIIVIMAFSIYFVINKNPLNGTAIYGNSTIRVAELTQQQNEVYIYIIIAGALLVIFLILLFLLYRCRQRCEQLFRKFLVLDILLIIAIGAAVLLYLVFQQFNALVEYISYGLVVWNFGIVGLTTFYQPCPGGLHRFFLVVLNLIMAVLITMTLRWYVVFFIILAVFGDVLSMIRPHLHIFTPFIVPRRIQLVYSTPRIFYEIDDLRLRASDFMFYGMMMGLGGENVLDVFSAFASVLGALVICVFVLPIFSKNFRPLPLAFLFLIISIFVTPRALTPYIFSQNRWAFVYA